MAGNKAAFLDRDGTLIHDVPYLGDPDCVKLVDDVVPCLKWLMAHGYLLIIVTNQSGIGRWRITLRQYKAVERRVLDLLAAKGVHITATYYCPHVPDAACPCRKPALGMFHRAERDWAVDLERSIMFGDKESDTIPGLLHNFRVPTNAPWGPWWPAATTLLPRAG